MTNPPRLRIASSVWQRFKGLMLSRPLPLAQGVVFEV